ncbi:tetratricopeptide repeat protein [Hymenobacter sp. BT175]|uniref:tetratricopeptide repeat protein n=1 Tax=Hymenobacter translucens TaxID=2886507 RepID=UPI001D0E2201|nr:tetratricopeptide repeat protein [Hymenobacter translucens]MCC2548648.1 tetratricopeptide repeat protein [Hymenobacter translucens]
MKNILLLLVCLCVLTSAAAQTEAQKAYEQGLQQAQAGKLDEAITLFSKSIELQPDDYFAWYNRGIARNMLGRHAEALADFSQTVKLAPTYKKGYLNRGITQRRLTNYEGAFADYAYAIRLDPGYGEAYYNRGLLYELLSKKDSACADFNRANKAGLRSAQTKVAACNDPASAKPTYTIQRLTQSATTKKYGFTAEQPVMVGTGPNGGPANQRAYLDLLRDPQGKPIKYKRLGGCCEYKSANGFLGLAMLDRYEITYLAANGKEATAVVYLSFYDYEEPKALLGFTSTGQ